MEKMKKKNVALFSDLSTAKKVYKCTRNTVIITLIAAKAKYNYNNLKPSNKAGNSSVLTEQINKNPGLACNEMYDKH